MNDSRSFPLILITVLLLFLAAAGALAHSGLLWGVNMLSFLPASEAALFFLIGIGGSLAILSSRSRSIFDRVAEYSQDKPVRFLIVLSAVFCMVAIFLRVRIPLLGDSFVLLNFLENTAKGAHGLSASREPLAMLYFYLLVKLLGTSSYPEIMNAFLIGELVLGIGFLAATFATMRMLFTDPHRRLIATCYAVAFPYMQLFLGYAELYAAVLFVHGVFALAVVLYLRGKISFLWIALLYVVETAVAYLGGVLLVVPLVYLAYCEYRANGWKKILPSLGVILFAGMAVLWFVGFRIDLLLPKSEHAHYLSVYPSTDIFQAYTLFSPYHFIDILNLLSLMAIPPLLMVGVSWRRIGRDMMRSPIVIVFLLCSGMLFLFIAVAKFDLPLAIDWDVTAPFFFFVVVISIILADQLGFMVHGRWMGVVVLVTLLTSAVYFRINASVDPNLARAKSILDRRIASQAGFRQLTFDLSMYYLHERQIDSTIALWKSYVGLFPDDGDGYEKLIKAYWELGEKGYGGIDETFHEWSINMPQDDAVRMKYADFCLVAGNSALQRGDLATAESRFRQAAEANPRLPGAYNNLGQVFSASGKFDSAMVYFARSVLIDSNYALGYKNMGKMCLLQGQAAKAIDYYRKAITLQPGWISAYEELATAYDAIGDSGKASEMRREAVRRAGGAMR